MTDKEKDNRPKAIVTGVTNLASRARVIGVELSPQELARRAAEFSRKCREYIGVDAQHGFGFEELQRCADRFGTIPTALILIRGGHSGANTWTLLVEDHYNRDKKIDLYSPVGGLVSPPLSGKDHQLFYFPGDGRSILDWQRFQAENPHYQLQAEPLQRLGPIQTTPADCGPLCLFARSLTAQQT